MKLGQRVTVIGDDKSGEIWDVGGTTNQGKWWVVKFDDGSKESYPESKLLRLHKETENSMDNELAKARMRGVMGADGVETGNARYGSRKNASEYDNPNHPVNMKWAQADEAKRKAWLTYAGLPTSLWRQELDEIYTPYAERLGKSLDSFKNV